MLEGQSSSIDVSTINKEIFSLAEIKVCGHTIFLHMKFCFAEKVFLLVILCAGGARWLNRLSLCGRFVCWRDKNARLAQRKDFSFLLRSRQVAAEGLESVIMSSVKYLR